MLWSRAVGTMAFDARAIGPAPRCQKRCQHVGVKPNPDLVCERSSWFRIAPALTLLEAAGQHSRTRHRRPGGQEGNHAKSRAHRCRHGPDARPGQRGRDRRRLPGFRTQHPQGQDPYLRRRVQPLLTDRGQQPARPQLPFALGDELVFHDQLFANGKQVGDDVGSCVIAALTPQLLANCSLVIRLPDGNLAGQFVAIQGPEPKQIALTGGTGSYGAAGGEGTLVEFGNGNGRLTLQVLSLVPRGKEA